MSHISRIASPMSLCEEDLFDVDKKVEAKIKFLEQRQKESPAAFLVGTIAEVNRRISNLDDELSKYESQIAIEKRTPEAGKRPESNAESYSAALSLRQTTPSEKKHELSKTYEKQPVGSSAKASDAPRLVELQQYPGWNPKRCNGLPHSLDVGNVLDHVIFAQDDLRNKSMYRREFCRLLYSELQESILQDSFWWFFLKRFHPDPIDQSRLFQRIAINFVSFLLSADIPKYRDLFFLNYGNILAQSIYSTFCLAFPQSWRQFDEPSFKETLSRICNEWIAGIPSPPKAHQKWNFTALEPAGMRKEAIKKKKKQDHRVKSLFSGGASSYSSAGSTKTSTMRSPTASLKAGGMRMITAKSDNASSGQSSKITPRVADLISEHNALSTITEEPLTSATESTADGKVKPTVPLNATTSCAAGRALEFSKSVFNVYGNSPLLAQFSKQYGFERKSFQDVLVNLTLIKTSPFNDVQTYQDIIVESKRNASTVAQTFRNIYQEDVRAHKMFCAKQREERFAFRSKVSKLLAKPKQVHYLSNLILMEMKNAEEDTNPVGATATVQTALSKESAN